MKPIGCGDEDSIGLHRRKSAVEIIKGGRPGFLGEGGADAVVDIDTTCGSEAAAIDGGIPIVAAHTAQTCTEQTNHW